ncbi:TIGR03086 family metal-binding protein [Rhodococcus maanshanensis]|uniref:TIGR03086 family protein n=1 Tax=Rhodococcus maanshanensis TaxID=183556 RepID=A0A1H7NPU7_9NOCA|nr:TIGR03086 family metal-binding protein [Rhodococcus maanshanensis]SEL24997.1 TIGR03086 family protein [Rhodococcus maanshanensis]
MTQFDRTVEVALEPDAAFELISRPERLRRWLTVAARVDLREGGRYRWTVVPGHSASGTFTEVVPGRRLKLRWWWEDSDDLPPGSSTVALTLTPKNGSTEIRLVHDGLTEAQEPSHAEVWNHYLDRLAVAGRDGDAGPDDWAVALEPSDEITGAEATLVVLQEVLRGLTADDLQRRTPCRDFTVAALAEHLLGSIRSLGSAGGGTMPAADAPGDVEVRVADAAQAATEGWRHRGLQGTVTPGSTAMPATTAVSILAIEFLVHAWDFATATGQRLDVPEQLASYVLGLAQSTISPQSRESGAFGEPVPVGDDAGPLERLIAFTGRSPSP